MPSGLTSRLSGPVRMVGVILSDHPNLRPTIPKSLLEICLAVAHNALHNPVGTAQRGVSGAEWAEITGYLFAVTHANIIFALKI